MKDYKGICRNKHKNWAGWLFIDTYHNLARENYKDFLEADKPLQKLVKKHYFRKKLNIVLFNISIYVAFYIIGYLLSTATN